MHRSCGENHSKRDRRGGEIIFTLKTAKDLPHHFFKDIFFHDPLPSGLLDPIFVKSNKTRIEIWTDQNKEHRVKFIRYSLFINSMKLIVIGIALMLILSTLALGEAALGEDKPKLVIIGVRHQDDPALVMDINH